jgi:hypothetical protein
LSLEGGVLDRKKFNKQFRTMTQDVIVELQQHTGSHPLTNCVGPKESGIYALYFKSLLQPIYIGSAKRSLRGRLKDHFKRLTGRVALEEVTVRFITFDSVQAISFEEALILHYCPEWNNSGFGNGDPDRSVGISKWHQNFPLLNSHKEEESEKHDTTRTSS